MAGSRSAGRKERLMIVVRNVFRLRIGAAREAQELWKKEGHALFTRLGYGPYRAFVDVTGPFYTFVLEGAYPSLSKLEEAMESSMATPEWKGWYARFSPLIESGYREILREVEA
ncbi:MAG: hypothetical protein EDX89_19580 [Acidobacteria bacterium]|nr:MAG: hypothetical protein EDX89_19580 [Acidobacteriota bacterium]